MDKANSALGYLIPKPRIRLLLETDAGHRSRSQADLASPGNGPYCYENSTMTLRAVPTFHTWHSSHKLLCQLDHEVTFNFF